MNTFKLEGDNRPYTIDWTDLMSKYGAQNIVESHWTLESGTILVGASFFHGNTVTVYLSGGVDDEIALLNNSTLFDTGMRLVEETQVIVAHGPRLP